MQGEDMRTLDPHCLMAENTTNVLEYAGGPHMQLGLFLRRALITFVRRGTLFQDRVAAVIVVVAVVGGCVLFWDRLGWERTTIAGAALFGLSTFGLLAVILASIAMALAGARVPSIAMERDHKSLESLLATRLSSAEIVLGTMVTGLVRSANWLAAALPIVVLVAIVGGVPPLLVLVITAGLGSSVFTAAALAATVSVYAPNRQKAFSVGIGLLLAWIEFPLFVEFLLPRVWPGSPRWFVQALHWLVDSSPIGVGASASSPTLVPRPFGLIEALLRMIALQMCGSSLLILWAAWQLRPASRALYDGDWPVLTRWMWRATLPLSRPRQPCGDDPVLWNELHSLRASSLAGRVAAGLGHWSEFGCWPWGLHGLRFLRSLSWPSVVTVRRVRDSPCRKSNPLARVLVGKLLLPAGSAAPGQARLEFNIALRQFSRSSSCFTS